MRLSQRLFAFAYDMLNAGVDGYITPYRHQTAGRAWGDVLEIGGGTGANLPFYPASVDLTVAEPNPYMVKRLSRKSDKLGRKVAIVPDIGEKLSFPDANFDSVVSTLVLCMVEDPYQVICEARRMLRPGGAFFFYEHVVSQNLWTRRCQNRINPIWKFFTTGCNLNRDIAGYIESAGFRQVEITHFNLSIWIPVTIPNIVGVARV